MLLESTSTSAGAYDKNLHTNQTFKLWPVTIGKRVSHPNGMKSISPGLARNEPTLGCRHKIIINPERVESIPHLSFVEFDFVDGFNPFRVEDICGPTTQGRRYAPTLG